MLVFLLAWSALAFSPGEAVDAAVSRSPSMELAQARIAEAEARLRGSTARLLPTVTAGASAVAQTEVEIDLADQLPLPLPDPSGVDPLLIQPGFQLLARVELVQPLLSIQAWRGRIVAREGLDVAEAQVGADRLRVARAAVEAWHAAAESRAVAADARRAEAEAQRLVERAEALRRHGIATDADILPFRHGLATARANAALAEEAVLVADGVLTALTGLSGTVDPPVVPTAPPPLAQLLADLRRPDLEAAAQRVEVARAAVSLERAGSLPTVALNAGAYGTTPAADLAQPLVWRVSVGASVPLFQGGAVAARVDEQSARVQQALAAERALRESAELEVRHAHGSLTRALASLAEQEEAVRLAAEAVTAAEARLDRGGGSLLDLHQARLEHLRAEALLTRARAQAARAADVLTVVTGGRP